MDSKVRSEFPSNINKSIENQIKLADTKAAWIFSVLSVITGALITKTSRIDWNSINQTRAMLMIGLSVIFLIFAFKQVIRVIYPRISMGNHSGMIYFGDIISQEKSLYVKKGLSISEEEMIKQLYEQAHALSNIVQKKFKSLKLALITTIISVISASISIIIL